MKNKRILIVGGAGFIGHNLALKLKKLKFNVSIVDSLEVNNILWLRDGIVKTEHAVMVSNKSTLE